MTRKLIPQLRFPEFQDAGEWEVKKLGSVANFLKGKGISKSEIDPQGETKCIRYGELYTVYAEVISEVISRTKLPNSELFLSKKNDVLIPSSGETKLDIAKASCVLLDGIALGSDLNVLRSNINGIFLSYLLNGVCKTEIAKKAQGDTVVHLYASQLRLLDIPITTLSEQQKIAECLASIDDRVTLETQKLDTLKLHKKGLMQKLFPAEGETLPQLRFPEFQDAGEWEGKTVGVSCSAFSGGTPNTANKEFYGGTIPFIRSAEIDEVQTELFLTKEGLTNSAAKMVKKGDILVALYGANSGDVALSKIEGAINQAILCLRHENNNSFVYQYLAYKKSWIISTYIQGGQGNLSGEIVKSVKLFFPQPKEQQKIAECLASLDELIMLQAQTIHFLKLHKKGLMQQLFPSV